MRAQAMENLIKRYIALGDWYDKEGASSCIDMGDALRNLNTQASILLDRNANSAAVIRDPMNGNKN